MKRLKPEQRAGLKEPFGPIVQDMQAGAITVGDQCSSKAIASGLEPTVVIYDRHIKRAPAPKEVSDAIDAYGVNAIKVINDAGTLSDDAANAVKEALQGNGRTKIEVEGEEDLLVLLVIENAPLGTIVYYGQPNEGIVEITITEDTKKRTSEIISNMEEI